MNAPPTASVEQQARTLVERLGGTWSANGGMCRCPAHEDRTPSLSIRPGRTRILLHCFAGCSAAEILRALQARGLLVPGRGGSAWRGAWLRRDALHSAALRLWAEARSVAGTPAADYLESRGLPADSAQLRFHPRTPLGRSPLTRYRPALLAAVRDDTGLVAVHRTFIAPSGPGRAPQRGSRRGLGRFCEGAVRFGGPGRVLGLAEGIETALSASALFGLRCWATLGSERLARIALPQDVEELRLFLDHDASGRRAERCAREAFAHVPRIEVHYPEQAGADWNDVLRRDLALPAS